MIGETEKFGKVIRKGHHIVAGSGDVSPLSDLAALKVCMLKCVCVCVCVCVCACVNVTYTHMMYRTFCFRSSDASRGSTRCSPTSITR